MKAAAYVTLTLLAVVPPGFGQGPVQVELFERVPAGSEFELAGQQAVERYAEPAFCFVRVPTKFSDNALPLDRSTPFVLRATFERAFPAGERQFRLRARGAAVLLLDGNIVAKTKAQPPNLTGDDPVPPPVVHENSPLRPAPYPHQDAIAKLRLDGRSHSFVLMAIIGGRGLAPSPGELAVSTGANGELERLLGPDGAPHLTDAEWEAHVASVNARHRAADIARRRAASEAVVAAWRDYHAAIREVLKSRPAQEVPQISDSKRVYNEIDRFIGARLEQAKAAPLPSTSDLEFLRRVSIDATGVIPTNDEIRAYLADPPTVRRSRAIDRLLASPSWADNWVSYWQDVLAENPGILKPDLNNTGPFRWWLHQSFTDNLPIDRMAAEIIEMDGSAVLGAPAAFAKATLNDSPMAAKADIIAQAFLAQKLGCARCHDAPFHPFKQKDLFSLGAMLEGKPLKLPVTSTVPLVPGARVPAVKISLKPGESIEPDWPFRDLIDHAKVGSLPGSSSKPSRYALASLVVAPENGRFAQVIVNRVWKRYMGLGLVEPADDWSHAKPSHPELLDYLATELMTHDYDLKHIARLIFSSKAYQRKPLTEIPDSSEKNRLFAGPLRRNLTAEQLVDSLFLSSGKRMNCEELNLNPAGDRPPSQFLNMGSPERAWEITALSNERDRPALALPIAQSLVDVMTAYGWRQSRQSAVTTRDDAASPMQTLILANGILGTRIVRLSDDSAFTALCLRDMPLEKLVEETFLRVLSRPPLAEEARTITALLRPYYTGRVVKDAAAAASMMKTDNRVSWSNHLSAEATLIRMEEERRLRMGDAPTNRLTTDFRERFEDTLWAMINSPEFVMVP
jgi:Protein of unknown function (DUF1553)/Protein of unknown function (DUF1549)